jgi:hypothetical protein
MNRATALLPLLLLAGCNVQPKNPASGDDNVSIRADDSGNIAFNLPIAEGQVKVPGPMMHNSNFDIDGVKLMPGTSVTGFNLNAHDEAAIVEMSFTAPASPDEVRSYFLDQFRKKGDQVTLAGDAVTGQSKDGDKFTIHVKPASNGSQGRIDIQSRH